ncbi:TonB-dependent receptor [Alteromonas sp. 1_MG-2023]|uniref:TonB-dependent receptor domain-containing protein n=1 Tax=Alteromonas sp. 1_MG-2023 TaxID=3062669 RepID=UPI0026E32A3B|nr:TonB-dependent receptor [Alteromonas sp. 1_MG-2023]MDO6474181.1 TonB-dependent receptor [Alteromonas sp. 1_MG-2023]
MKPGTVKTRYTMLASAIIASFFHTASFAQDEAPATPDGSDIEHIVISATGFEQKLTEAPASISVISQEDLQSRQFITLLDAVQFQEGIDIGTTRDKTGQGTVSMRGLTGEYTLLLIDGVRMNNHGDIYPNNFGGNAFGHVPPMEAIERIEVIRGPASTLYGADALGGVINVITKKRSEDWTGSINFGRSIQTDDQFGDDITTDFFAQGPLIKDLLTLGVRGSMYERQASNPEFAPDVDPNGDIHIRELGFGSGGKTVDSDSKQFGFTLFFTPFENQSFKFDYDNSNQTYDNTPTYNIDTGEISYPLGTKDNIESIWADRRGVVNPRAGYAADQEFNREWWSITHQGQFDGFSSMVALSHVDTTNDGRTLPLSVAERLLLQEMYDGTGAYEGMTEEERKALAEDTFLPRPERPLESSQYTLDVRVDIPVTEVMGDHNIVLGGQVIDGELLDGVFGLEDSNAGGVQEQKMWSLFAEDNWSPNDYLTLTAGARYDEHDVFGSQVSPRIYAVYTFNDNWTVKGGVSTGYKTPNTTDLYDGITGFGGQGTSPFAGNPDLQPETSVNSEIAVYWNSDAGHNFNLTYFNTQFEDKIASGDTVYSCEVTGGVRPCVNLGDYDQLGYQTYSQKINIDKVDLQGIEMAGRVQISPEWFVTANYTWTDSEQKSGPEAGQPLTNTAEHMANITVNWDMTEDFSVYLQSQIRSDRYRGWDSTLDKPLYYKNYQLMTLGARYRITEYVSVNARINNLLDEDFTSYTTEYNDLNGDGSYEYLTGRGVVSEVVFLDDYNIKDRARNLWVGVNVKF